MKKSILILGCIFLLAIQSVWSVGLTKDGFISPKEVFQKQAKKENETVIDYLVKKFTSIVLSIIHNSKNIPSKEKRKILQKLSSKSSISSLVNIFKK